MRRPQAAGPGARAPGTECCPSSRSRRLWIALSLSSLGDWLSILALLALAASVTHGSNLAKTASISAVWVVTLLPALLLGPVAGALADRFDRRVTMVVGCRPRPAVHLDPAAVPNLTWIFVAKFLAGSRRGAARPHPRPEPRAQGEAGAGQPAQPADRAPRRSRPAALLAVLGYAATLAPSSTPTRWTSRCTSTARRTSSPRSPCPHTADREARAQRADLRCRDRPLWRLPQDAGRARPGGRDDRRVLRARSNGLAPSYIQYTLDGGSAGFSLVFAVILIGLAMRMGSSSRPFGDFSRRRLFGVTLTASAIPLAMTPGDRHRVRVPHGTAYPTGFTIVSWKWTTTPGGGYSRSSSRRSRPSCSR